MSKTMLRGIHADLNTTGGTLRFFTIAAMMSFFSPCAMDAQFNDPSDFLAALPSPPRTSQEAVRRCPEQSDTLLQRWSSDLKSCETREQEAIERDSLSSISQRRLSSVSKKDLTEYRALQQEVDGQRDSLIARLQRLAARPAEDLLNAIRAIGEELDHNITTCPKVGAMQIYDSLCVAAAEGQAAEKRIVATNEFLSRINSHWGSAVQPLRESFLSREKRITKLHSATKPLLFRLQLKRLRRESWRTLEPLLRTVDEVTRLAAQFTR